MRFWKMRLVDDWAGPVLCFLANLVLHLVSPFRPKTAPLNAPGSILIVKFLGIGSIVHLTPMIQAVRDRHPGSRLIFLTFEKHRAIWNLQGLADDLLTVRSDKFSRLLADSLRVILRLRTRERPEAVVCAEFFAKYSTLMSLASGARVRVGFYHPQRWQDRIFTHTVPFHVTRHVRDSFASLASPLDAPYYGDRTPRIAAPEACRLSLERKLEAMNVDPSLPSIVVNANAGELALERRWPAVYFAALTEKIAAEFPDLRIYFIGAAEEKGYVASVLDLLPERPRASCVDLSGKIDLGELAALIERAALTITNDSGPLHLATALGRPTVSFFGPETPTLYGPLGAGHAVFYKNLPCSPCMNVYDSKKFVCANSNRCMTDISVEEVFPKVKEALTRSPCPPA